MSSKGSVYSLAHELGHALGASDCYARTDESVSVSRWFGTVLPRKTNFGSAVRDWGGSAEGRGFCAKADRHASFLNKCLRISSGGYSGRFGSKLEEGGQEQRRPLAGTSWGYFV